MLESRLLLLLLLGSCAPLVAVERDSGRDRHLIQPVQDQLIDSLGNNEMNRTAVELEMAERMTNDMSRQVAESLAVGRGDAEVTRDVNDATALEIKMKLAEDLLGLLPIPKVLQAGLYLGKAAISLSASSPTQVLTQAVLERFRTVNHKLTNLKHQLSAAVAKLQAGHEASTALTPYRELHSTVRNVAIKLDEILAAVARGASRRQFDRLAEEFVGFCVSSRLEEKLLNLHSAATRTSTADIGANMFDAYNEPQGCSTSQLLAFGAKVVMDYASGSQLQIVYQLFRNDRLRAADSFRRTRDHEFEIRQAFYQRYWYCLEHTSTVAMSAARSLQSESVSDPVREAERVQKFLQSRFHRFNWAVIVGSYNLTSVGMASSENFFELPEISPAPRLLVIFTDKERQHQCRDASRALLTRLVFSCPSDTCAYVTSPGFSSSRSCPGVSLPGTPARANWMTWSEKQSSDGCPVTNACNSHGECRQTPVLRRPVCMCQQHYRGPSCEFFDNPNAPLTRVIADMRDSVGDATGLKTTVDVFYRILDVEHAISTQMHGLSACTELNALIRHGLPIDKAMYMATTYSRLLKSELTIDQFGNLLRTHISGLNMDYFMRSLLGQLLGIGPLGLRNTDLVGLYKRCLTGARGVPACSLSFVNAVQNLTQNVVVMNEAVAESLLTFYSWAEASATPADRVVLRYLLEFRNRTAQLRAHWAAESCPALQQPLSEGLQSWSQRHCNAHQSFQGAELTVECGEDWLLNTEERIVCTRGPERRLRWSQQPQCRRKPQWLAWNSWSTCSTTCDNGTRQRYRCLGDACTDRRWQTETCNIGNCCDLQYGPGRYFTCNRPGNRKCIWKWEKCDDFTDCPDGSDEAGCQFVRAGQLVCLRPNRFLNNALYCYFHAGGWWSSHKSRCYQIAAPVAASKCSNADALFWIHSPGLSDGDIIRSGSKIGLKHDREHGQWLSCINDDCSLRGCPGNDPGRLASECSGEWFHIYKADPIACRNGGDCSGLPIVWGDKVALKKWSNTWLKLFDNGKIFLDTCLGDGNPINRIDHCPNEAWRIYN